MMWIIIYVVVNPFATMYVVNPMLCDDDILYVVNHAMVMLCMLKVSMLSCDESYI